MICQEDNTLRCERDYHDGLHCTIDPINKGTTTLFLENNGANKGTTTLFLKQRNNHFISIIAFLDQNKVVVPFFLSF